MMLPSVDKVCQAFPLAGLVLVAASTAGAQTTQVLWERSLSATPTSSFIEPHLAANPANPQHLVAIAMEALSPDLTRLDCTAFTTVNGGADWLAHRLQQTAGPGCGDPWVVITPRGTAVLAVLIDSGIGIFRSADGGRSWPAVPYRVAGAHDHQTMTVDSAGVIYLASGLSRRDARGRTRSHVFLAASSDDGRTFVERSVTTPSNLAYEAQTVVTTRSGVVAVPFSDHRDARSRRLLQRRSWLLVSRDAGRSMSVPLLITERCAADRMNAWPSLLASTPGNPQEGRLFFLCEQAGFNGIQLVRSDDDGETWQDAVRVDDSTRVRAWTRTPAMAMDAEGLLGVTWVDRDAAPEGTCHRLVFAASADAGRTFTPAATVASSPSCNLEEHNGGVGQRFPNGGDYAGLVAVGPGRFVAAWADGRAGRLQIWGALIEHHRQR